MFLASIPSRLWSLLLCALVVALPAQAQEAPVEFQSRPSVKNAYGTSIGAKSTATDAFTLTDGVGVELMKVDPYGRLFIGDQGTPQNTRNILNVQNDADSLGGIAAIQNGNSGLAALYAESNADGRPLVALKYGATGSGVAVGIQDANNPNTAFLSQHLGLGRAALFGIFNASNDSVAAVSFTQGLGPAHVARISNGSNGAPAMLGITDGVGPSGQFEIQNGTNDNSALNATTTGTGSAGYFRRDGEGSSYGPAVQIQQNGTADWAPALVAEMNNANNGAPAVVGLNGSGTGPAGEFVIENTASSAPALQVSTQGTGNAALFRNDAAGNTSPVVDIQAAGTGRALQVQINNTSSNNPAIWAQTTGTGVGADIGTLGEGRGLNIYRLDNSATGTSNASIFTFQGGNGAAVEALHQGGSGSALDVSLTDAGNNDPALSAVTQGGGVGARIEINNTGSAAVGLEVVSNGTGPLAEFNANGDVKMRVQADGNVFADGTFIGGGADVAEAFEVEGAVKSYEPGDVLTISTRRDRTVVRSDEAYSSRVVGVYATKPGVLLSEKGVETNWSERVPMGVIGVIPTKVTLEGGAIQRGDLLVTSSTPGHAMKADPSQLGFGQVIGKALQPYDGTGPALIEVLVNVK